MTASIFQPALVPAIDANGDTISGATWTFYTTGTTTKTTVYSEAELETAHANPLTSDSGGVFPAIYIDQDTNIRAILRDGVGRILRDIDPYIPQEYRLKAVLAIYYGQSLTKYQATQVTTATIPGLYQFVGGSQIEEFPDFFAAAYPGGDPQQNHANYASIVPFVPLTGYETPLAGLGAQILREDDVEACLVFSPGYSGMSARLLKQGNNLFRELENALCYGVRHLEALGYSVEVRIVWNQGHANADSFNDGGSSGETPTTATQYKLILKKMRDAIWRAARAATGRAISPTIWIVPLQTGGASYTLSGVRGIQAGQLSAVQAYSGLSFTPPYSQFAPYFQNDLVHPYGTAYRPHAEATALMMVNDISPPVMTAATIINSTTLDVTFDQDVVFSDNLAEAAGYTNDHSGFQCITSGGAYVSVTGSVVHPTASNKIRLTVATTGLAGGSVLNGQQWSAAGVGITAASHFPRTHVIGTEDIGTAIDGTVLENFAIPQSMVIS